MAKPFNHLLRNHILKTAFKLFRQQGFHNTTTREIAAAANIERGLLHHYFSKKQKIVFTLYVDFLDCLLNYISRQYSDKDAYQLIALFNALYYRIIFLRDDIVGIFRDILENRDLTRVKIEKTADIYFQLLQKLEAGLPKSDVQLSCLVAIGAEVELVLSILDGRLPWTRAQLCAQITRLEFLNLPCFPPKVAGLIDQAEALAESSDLRVFSDFMAEQCPWFRLEDMVPVPKHN